MAAKIGRMTSSTQKAILGILDALDDLEAPEIQPATKSGAAMAGT